MKNQVSNDKKSSPQIMDYYQKLLSGSNNKGDKNLKIYLREIAKYEKLPIDKEVALAKLASQGDSYAKEQLILHNLYFVVHVARTFQNTGLDFLDLIQEGNMGLMEAIDNFDYTRGYRLTTYAKSSIISKLSRAIYEKGSPIKIPYSARKQIKQMETVKNSLSKSLGRDPTLEEMQSEMGLSKKEIKKLLSMNITMVYIDAPATNHGVNNDLSEMYTIGDFLLTDSSMETESIVEANDSKKMIRKAFSTLDKREQVVLTLHFGLGGQEKMSYEDIATQIGVSYETARAIQKKALRKLKEPSIRHYIEDYYE